MAFQVIKRIHSDEEPGIRRGPTLRHELAARATRLTCCTGWGSERAGSAIGRMSGRARAIPLGLDIGDAVVSLTWPYLMAYTCHLDATSKMKNDCPAARREDAQFYQTILVHTGDSGRVKPRYYRALYLCQAPTETMGHLALPVYSDRNNLPTIKGVTKADNCKIIKNSYGSNHFTDKVNLRVGISRLTPLKTHEPQAEADFFTTCQRCARSPAGICVRHKMIIYKPKPQSLMKTYTTMIS